MTDKEIIDWMEEFVTHIKPIPFGDQMLYLIYTSYGSFAGGTSLREAVTVEALQEGVTWDI